MSIVSTIPKSFTQGKTAAPLAIPPATEVTPTAKAGYMLLNWEEEERLRALETFENNPSPLNLVAHNPGEVPLTITAAPGQTGYLFQVYAPSGLVSFYSPNGTFYSAEGTVLSGQPGGAALIINSGAPNTVTGVIVQNAAGFPYLGISNPETNDCNIINSYGYVLIAGAHGNGIDGTAIGQTGGSASVFNNSIIGFPNTPVSISGNVSLQKALVINGQDTVTPHQYGFSSGTYGAGIFSFADNTSGKNIFIVNSNGTFFVLQPMIVSATFTIYDVSQTFAICGFSNPQAHDTLINNPNGYINLAGNEVMLGLPAPALTATTGLPYMPATAGTPTGVPTPETGWVPFRYDTTNHKLWIYDAGWKGVVVA